MRFRAKKSQRPAMDSSLKNPGYGQRRRRPPSAPLPPLPPPPIPNQFHSEWFNCYDRSNSRQSDPHHLNYHNYTHRQDLPPNPPVNQPSSYYSPPPRVSYESPRDFAQPASVGFMENRHDSWIVDAGSDRNYQLEHGHRTRDLDRDGFHGLGYANKDFGERYRDNWQSESESDRIHRFLGAGTSFGYGAKLPRDAIMKQRWVEPPYGDERSRFSQQNDDYYHSENGPCFDNGGMKGSSEPNQTTEKPHQKGKENDRFNSFKGIDHSGYGSMDRKETSCTAGKVILSEVTKKNEIFSQPNVSDIDNSSKCSQGGVPIAGKSMSCLQSQPCEDELPDKDMDDLSKLLSHADDKGAVAHVKDYAVVLPLPDSPSKTALSSISEKTQKKANNAMHAAEKSFPHSLYGIKKDANPQISVTKNHTWHRKSDTSASPLVAVKPKVTVQSSSTYVRKGNSLLRKPSPGSPGEAQTLQRHARPPSDSTSSRNGALSSGMDGLPVSSSGEADDPDFVSIQTGYASDFEPKQNPPKLESSNPSNILYIKRKANQLVAASDIHGASKSEMPPFGGYHKRSKNRLVRNSESLANQAKSLSDDALDSQTAIMRPFNQSKFSLVWTLKEPLSRNANRVHISPQKTVLQPVPWKRVTYRNRLMNPASVLRNGYFSTISRKLLMMRKRRTVYRRSTNGYTLKTSKVSSIGGSHLKWSKSIERDSKKSEFLSDVESSRSDPSPESGKDTKKSSTRKRMVIGNDETVWIRNGNQLVRGSKKRTRALANEKVRWSRHNVRLRLAKRRNYCQFFTRFGKCNKDDGKCLYIHDPSKIAVCTKFLGGLCANPDCKLTHKVVAETMPDCYYFLQGLCNNESCPYRHVHVHQNAAICEGFLRGYCSDGNECRKKHTYTCPVFEATGSCSQGSECKLHHPKNRRKGTKRKRTSETWEKNGCGRYFGSLHKDLPESEPMLVNELATTDDEVFGREGSDFIRLDVNEHEASENMDSSLTESVSDDSEGDGLIDELIRPVGLMQK